MCVISVSSASGWQKAMENEADWFEKDLNEFEMLSNKETDASKFGHIFHHIFNDIIFP